MKTQVCRQGHPAFVSQFQPPSDGLMVLVLREAVNWDFSHALLIHQQPAGARGVWQTSMF